MGKKQPGDPFSFSAKLYNDLGEVVKSYHQNRLNQTGQAIDGPGFWVKNTSGGDLARHSILGIDGVVFDHADNADEFKNRPTLSGITPALADHTGKFVVMTEPADNNKFARCILDGVAVCQVDITDSDHEHCDIKDAYSSELESYGIGSSQILHKPSGTGVKWCLVRLGVRHVAYKPLVRFTLNDALTTSEESNAATITHQYGEGIDQPTTTITVWNMEIHTSSTYMFEADSGDAGLAMWDSGTNYRILNMECD